MGWNSPRLVHLYTKYAVNMAFTVHFTLTCLQSKNIPFGVVSMYLYIINQSYLVIGWTGTTSVVGSDIAKDIKDERSG